MHICGTENVTIIYDKPKNPLSKMQKKIQIKSIYENKFVAKKGKIKSPKTIEKFYDLIFNTKEYLMTKEEVKKLQNFFNNLN